MGYMGVGRENRGIGEGCAEGKAASGSGLEGAPIESQKEVQNYCFMELGWCVSRKNRCSLTCLAVWHPFSITVAWRRVHI